jgi:hypothetical protein
VHVPKATVHQNYLFVLWQHNIGLARKSFVVERETISEAMYEGPNELFRICVPASYTGHVASALFGCEVIGHYCEKSIV